LRSYARNNIARATADLQTIWRTLVSVGVNELFALTDLLDISRLDRALQFSDKRVCVILLARQPFGWAG
jgi:hypothetical protein